MPTVCVDTNIWIYALSIPSAGDASKHRLAQTGIQNAGKITLTPQIINELGFALKRKNATLTSLIQLEYSGFDGATVPICTFTLSKAHIPDYTGSYIKLSDFKGHENQAPKTLEAIKNSDCGWFYNAKPDDFKKISGSPVAFWVSDKIRDIFTNSPALGEVSDARQGLATADNDRFLRLWHEIEVNRIGFGMANREQAKQSAKKWFPFNKAGAFHKWYGNQDFVLNWANDGEEIRNFTDDEGKQRSVIRNPNYYFQESVSWSDVTSSTNAFRVFPVGFIHGNVAHSIFNFSEKEKLSLLSYCNNKFCSDIIKILSPTMHFDIGYFNNLPYPKKLENYDLSNVNQLIEIAKTDWNNYETSWDFTENPLIRQKQNFVGWVSDSVTVRPELVEGWTVKPFMIRQAHHERLNLLKLSRLKLVAINHAKSQVSL
jgi:hypothetical protein